MICWAEFTTRATDLASIGLRHLYTANQGEIALLATINAQGSPSLAPVCPIFSGRGIYLLTTSATPKSRHLQERPNYALHAQVGADDEEFRISGTARLVTDNDERSAVLADVPFPTFDPADPLFELMIDKALVVTWPSPGEPSRRLFRAAS